MAVTVVSVAFLIAAFNESLSWERGISDPEVQKEWLKNSTITNSLLGISIDVDDAPILGSLSLYILAMWFFYAMRRENHLIASLLIDAAETKDKKIMSPVYHGISSNLVFITISEDDEPIKSISKTNGQLQNKAFFIRIALKIVMFLPALTLLLILISSVISLAQISPVRDHTKVLFLLLSPIEQVQAAIATLVCAVATTAIFNICCRITKFAEGTGHILREFGKLI